MMPAPDRGVPCKKNDVDSEGNARQGMLLLTRALMAALVTGFALAANPALVLSQLNEARGSIPEVSDQEWVELAQRSRWGADDATILRILYRLPNISDSNWQQYAVDNRSTPLTDLIADPMRFVSRVYHFKGIAQQVEKVPVPPDKADEFSFDHYFLTRIESEEGNGIVVISRTVPRAWKSSQRIQEPTEGFGYFLMKGEKDQDEFPVFAATSLAWYPNPSSSTHELTQGQIVLARNRFDVAQFDGIENNTTTAILPEENDVFFELLAAAHSLKSSVPVDAESWDLIELMKNPDRHLGELLTVTGNVRRITPVKVTDPEVRRKIEIEQYYQLDVFVSLGKRRLRVTDDKGNEINTQGSFGVTIILSELPDHLNQSQHRNPRISVPGFFFKQWRHRTLTDSGERQDLLRPNPMFVGIPSQLNTIETDASSTLGTVMGIFFVVVVLAVVALIWWSNRGSGHSRLRGTRDVDLSKL